MQFKLLSLAAMAAAVSAQTMNLTAALTSNPDLSNLTSFVGLFPQLATALGAAKNVTILAPSNAAFAKFMNSSAGSAIASNDSAAIQALLTYHVLNGTYPASAVTSNASFIPTMLNNMKYSNVTGGQRVEAIKVGQNVTFFSGLLQNSTVTKADTNFTGGVIHVIDTVLTVPQNISTTAVAAGLSAAAGALTQAKLVSTVDTTPDLTVFVPNNMAFQNIGSAVGNLSIDQLTAILGYHVIKGSVLYSSMLMNGSSAKTLQGNNITVTLANGTVFVNSAKVIVPDVLVANGVVHVIDNVLNPNDTSATPIATATSQTVAFSGASSATTVPFTSGVPVASTTLGGGAAVATSTAAAAASSSSGVAAPMRTGAIGAAALFAAGGVLLNA